MPHSIINGYKNILAISVGTDYTFPLADKVKGTSPTPARLPPRAAAAAVAAARARQGARARAEEEEEEAMDFDLFD